MKAQESAKQCEGSVEKSDTRRAKSELQTTRREIRGVLDEGRNLRGVFDRSLPPGMGGGLLKGFSSAQLADRNAEKIYRWLSEIARRASSTKPTPLGNRKNWIK